MKRKLALLMCAVMLLCTMLACIPASAATAKTAGGPLAITELCYAPEDEKYEFIEVMNTSDNAIDVKDYYVYRFGFSNGGTYHADGILQMMGEANLAKLVKVSLENAEGESVLAKGELAVIWFASAVAKDYSINDFKNYWTTKGADLSNAKVIRVTLYDANGTDLYAANDTKSNSGINGPNANSGSTFLPDKQAGFIISFINKSYAATDTITGENGIVDTKEKTKERHSMADSMALLLLDPTCKQDVSAHYYEFIDRTKYSSTASNMTFDDSIPADKRIVMAAADMPYALMFAMEPEAGKAALSFYTSTKNQKTIIFPTVNTDYLSNPGSLYIGQMGNTTGEVPAKDPANGVGSIVLNNYKPSVENLALGNKDEETDNGGETTAAPVENTGNTNNTTTEEEGGCGSVVAGSAIAVLAPVMAIGCTVTLKRRRRKED